MMKNYIKKWLGIKEPVDWSSDFNNLKKIVDDKLYEYDETLKRFCEVKCTVCDKTIVTYPFGGGYYRESDGDVICSGKCLDKKQAAQ